MVYDVAVGQVNCLEGNQSLLKAPYVPGIKTHGWNMPGAHIRSSLELLQDVVCSRLKTSSLWRSPVTMAHPISLLPAFPSENLIAFLSQGHSEESTLIPLKN